MLRRRRRRLLLQKHLPRTKTFYKTVNTRRKRITTRTEGGCLCCFIASSHRRRRIPTPFLRSSSSGKVNKLNPRFDKCCPVYLHYLRSSSLIKLQIVSSGSALMTDGPHKPTSQIRSRSGVGVKPIILVRKSRENESVGRIYYFTKSQMKKRTDVGRGPEKQHPENERHPFLSISLKVLPRWSHRDRLSEEVERIPMCVSHK